MCGADQERVLRPTPPLRGSFPLTGSCCWVLVRNSEASCEELISISFGFFPHCCFSIVHIIIG